MLLSLHDLFKKEFNLIQIDTMLKEGVLSIVWKSGKIHFRSKF